MRPKLFTIFFLTLILCFKVKAQNNKLHLYASFGAKQLKSHQLFYPREVTPAIGSSLGAGSLFQRRNFLLGTEFYYSKGYKEIDAFQADYSGFNTSFLVGYQVYGNTKLKLNFLTGFGYSLNHMYVTDMGGIYNEHFNSAMFHNKSYYLPASILLQKVRPNGTFWSIKAGYNFNISGKNEWEFREKDQHHHFNAKSEGFYLQLLLGGLLNL